MDIPGVLSPVQIESTQFRGPVSEALLQLIGGNINALIARNLRFIEFTANGTWTVPSDIGSKVILFGCGGGGGGASGPVYNYGSGLGSVYPQGGYGSIITSTVAKVTAADTIGITIGAYGTGGSGTADGVSGGDTIFSPTSDPVIKFLGAPGGKYGQIGVSIDVYSDAYKLMLAGKNHTAGGWNNEFNTVTGIPFGTALTTKTNGQSSPQFAGGTTPNNAGGGGGAGSFAKGGDGSLTNGSDAGASDYGSGGGAGLSNGGKGAPGYLCIAYYGGT